MRNDITFRSFVSTHYSVSCGTFSSKKRRAMEHIRVTFRRALFDVPSYNTGVNGS